MGSESDVEEKSWRGYEDRFSSFESPKKGPSFIGIAGQGPSVSIVYTLPAVKLLTVFR
jgi:hypothetical protein